MHGCCIQDLRDLLSVAVTEFDKHGILYELEGGSLVGAVKMGDTLPWELDHDFNILAANISAAMKLTNRFKELGYGLYSEKDISKCVGDPNEINCGYLGLRSPQDFRMELWGMNGLSNDVWTKQGLPYTKVKVHRLS